MSPDRLGTALRDLVDDVEQGVAPPVAGELWAGGRRRRRTARLVPVLAAACVAALVTLALWPGGAPSRLGAGGHGSTATAYARLTSYPSAIPKPPSIPGSAAPGITAAVLGDRDGYDRAVRRVTRRGGRVASTCPDPGDVGASRGVARRTVAGAAVRVLTDLVRRGRGPVGDVRSRLQSTPDACRGRQRGGRRTPAASTSTALNQGPPSSSGFVVGTDGSVTEAPLLSSDVSSRSSPGWLDDETVLALVRRRRGPTDRFGARTWTGRRRRRGGSPVPTCTGPPGTGVVGASSTWVQAGLSPDATRLLVTRLVTDIETKTVQATEAMLFDAAHRRPARDAHHRRRPADRVRSGRRRSLTWTGGGCRPAWRDELPVITDDGIRPAVDVRRTTTW